MRLILQINLRIKQKHTMSQKYKHKSQSTIWNLILVLTQQYKVTTTMQACES